jgi:hypothetical protein
MPEPLLLVVVFVAGCAAGAAVAWAILRPPRSSGVTLPANTPIAAGAPAKAEPGQESELTTASRQLLSELETRYQGRTANGDEEPGKRRRSAPRPRAARRPRT